MAAAIPIILPEIIDVVAIAVQLINAAPTLTKEIIAVFHHSPVHGPTVAAAITAKLAAQTPASSENDTQLDPTTILTGK